MVSDPDIIDLSSSDDDSRREHLRAKDDYRKLIGRIQTVPQSVTDAELLGQIGTLFDEKGLSDFDEEYDPLIEGLSFTK